MLRDEWINKWWVLSDECWVMSKFTSVECWVMSKFTSVEWWMLGVEWWMLSDEWWMLGKKIVLSTECCVMCKKIKYYDKKH